MSAVPSLSARSGGLMLMPSFYGLVMWVGAFGLYTLRLVAWNASTSSALLLFGLVIVAYAASLMLFWGRYAALKEQLMANAAGDRERFVVPVPVLLVLHAVGLLGLSLYVRDFAGAFGGWQGFFVVFASTSHEIRWQAQLTTSLGTQVSYFGWVAIALTFVSYRERRMTWLLGVLCLVQLGGNLLFVDRTRPVWIVMTTILVAMVPWQRSGTVRLLVRLAILCGLLLSLFMLLASFIGKVPDEGVYGRTVLSPELQNVYVYVTGGFAYFNQMLSHAEPIDWWPSRTLAPLWVVLAKLGLAQLPPDQVIGAYRVPFAMNVGTFLEPYYRDGGVWYCVVGIFLHTIAADAAGLWLLRRRRPLALYGWATFCFVAFISFFTPKLTTFPVWLFLFLAVAAEAIRWLVRMLPDRILAVYDSG